MSKINLSRIPKFGVHELVKVKTNETPKLGFWKSINIFGKSYWTSLIDSFKELSKVGVVHMNTGVESCWVKFPNQESIPIPENNLRKITFKEFVLYIDPNTGGLKIGRNKALPIVFSLIMAIVFIISSMSVEGPWKLAPIGISVGIFVVNYLGLRYNFTKRWV